MSPDFYVLVLVMGLVAEPPYFYTSPRHCQTVWLPYSNIRHQAHFIVSTKLYIVGHDKMQTGWICGAACHWSVLIPWLIRILSFSPAVCIQQFAALTLTQTVILTLTSALTVTLQWSLIGLRDLQIVTVQIRPDPHFVTCCIFWVILLVK